MNGTDSLNARFDRLFGRFPLNSLIRNAQARTDTLLLDGVRLPVTLTDGERPNCYTVSPHSALIDYGRDETVKLPLWQGAGLRAVLGAAGAYLRFAEIDKVAVLNNYCLSTNTFSREVCGLDAERLTEAALARYPDRALLIRSLNTSRHAGLLERLGRLNWQQVASRQVYLFERDDMFRHQNSRRDAKLLDDGRFVFVPCAAEADYRQAEHWYNRLYLDKYSRQNVQFTAFGLQQMHAAGIILPQLLVDTGSGASVAVLGTVADDGEITAPLVGYDLETPQSAGLYRRVIAQVLRQAADSGLKLNLSSGAPQFKRLRGGIPTIEYTAVYSRHLPLRRRLPWQILAHFSPSYAGLLQRHEL